MRTSFSSFLEPSPKSRLACSGSPNASLQRTIPTRNRCQFSKGIIEVLAVDRGNRLRRARNEPLSTIVASFARSPDKPTASRASAPMESPSVPGGRLSKNAAGGTIRRRRAAPTGSSPPGTAHCDLRLSTPRLPPGTSRRTRRSLVENPSRSPADAMEERRCRIRFQGN
jgi:hypothetical protein